MDWRDLFYFSSGERMALTVLCILITVSLILLILKKESLPVKEPLSVDAIIRGNDSVFLSFPLKEKEHTVFKNPSDTSKISISSKQMVDKYVPKQKQTSSKSSKFPIGTKVELNTADTTILKKVPGIGTTFAKRIIKYRNLLGGFYSVEQLKEVYGIDEEKYETLMPWFIVDTFLVCKIPVNEIITDSLIKHPYLNYKQVRVISKMMNQKGRLSGWGNLSLLDEFTEEDLVRLQYYISFD